MREELKGTFLEKAPVCKVSAATGQGLEELIQVIEHMTSDEVVAKDVNTIPRLPIDRAFTLSGFGTIITGTLCLVRFVKKILWKCIRLAKSARFAAFRCMVRIKKECYAGQRVAINLSNVKKKEIQRGCVLAPPASMKNTDLLDVKMNILDSSMRVLTNHTRLHLFTGTSEIYAVQYCLIKRKSDQVRVDMFNFDWKMKLQYVEAISL